MLLAALRDLQFRRRRFAITAIATGLVFSMGLLMSGLSNAFTVEISRTLLQSGGERWIAPSTAAGPFSAGITIRLDGFDETALPGVLRADPVLFTRSVARVGGRSVDVNVFGVVPGGLGAPPASRGATPRRSGEMMVDRRLGTVGDQVAVFGRSFDVVGALDDASLFAGSPSLFMVLSDAQALVTDGQNLATMIITKGTPTNLPAGMTAFDSHQAAADLARPLQNATRSIDFIRVLLWVVAALIIASVIYLSALERTRDFAVFKATGVSTRAIAAGLVVQAIVIALTASAIGAAFALLLAPRFPLDVVISSASLWLLPIVAVVVGIASSIVGLRRIVEVQPATAFAGP